MGEYADMSIDAGMDDEDNVELYLLGEMPFEEAYNSGIIDEFGEVDSDC